MRPKSIPIDCIAHAPSFRSQLLQKMDPMLVPLPPQHKFAKALPQEERLLSCSMLFSGPHGTPNLPLLKEHLKRQGRLEHYAAVKLIRQTAAILRAEPNVVEMDAPVIIVGDIHGQFYDMLNFLDLLGSPADNRFVFLGDYVDRGDFSTEVVLYLFALKICFPTQIRLLRGNHETRLMCEYMTFLLECHNKYTVRVYEEFVACFDCLPLAAVIHKNCNGDILCMHGGLSPFIHTLADIEKINRFVEPPSEGALCDLLWSDPVTEYDPDSPEWLNVSRRDWEDITFRANKQRKTSFMFGKKAVNSFLSRNNLFCIVRAHQVQDNGFKDHKYFNPSRHLSEVFTIFSAPNYCDYYKNYGAVMKITERPFDIKTFVWKQHPVVLEDFQDAMSFSLDYVMEGLITILQELIVGIKDDKNANENPEEKEALEQQGRRFFLKVARSQERRQLMLAVNETSYHKNMSLFEKAVQADSVNEQRPTPEMIIKKYQQHPGVLRKGVSSPALLQKEQQTHAADVPQERLQKLPLAGTPKFGKEKGGSLCVKPH